MLKCQQLYNLICYPSLSQYIINMRTKKLCVPASSDTITVMCEVSRRVLVAVLVWLEYTGRTIEQ